MDAGIASLAATRAEWGGGGNWMSPTRPERLRRRLTAGVDKKKTKQNQTKQTSKQPQQKAGKKIKNTWWKSNNAIKVFSL